MHSVDVKVLISSIQDLYASDAQLFKDIVCSLDLSDIFAVPRKNIAGKNGLLQTNKPIVNFVFLLQAIEARFIAGVTLALWDVRAQIDDFATIEIVIAKYFAEQNGFDQAVKLLDYRLDKAMYRTWSPNHVPYKLSREEQKYLYHDFPHLA